MDRRQILVGGVSAAALVFGGGAAWVLTRDTDPAKAPWRAAEDEHADPRIAALHYAILAPNPHNRQPWLIELIGADMLRVYRDGARMLEHTDPPNRQITIGFGAFLELLRMAARAQGYVAEVTPFPAGADEDRLDDRPVADVRFVQAALEIDPLFEAVLDRRTNREAYDSSRPVPNDDMARIADAISSASGLGFRWTSDPNEVSKIAAIATEGWNIESATKRTHEESVRLTRIGADEINAEPDGISLSGAFLEVAGATGILTRNALRQPGSYASSEGVKMYHSMIESAPTFGWLTSRGNSRIDQLNTGAAWVRVHLAATLAGIALHPLSQVLQEFPEMAEQFRIFHESVGVDTPSRVQGLFRFGYAPKPEPSPRWPVETRLI